jgi:DNA-binding MarR family transcriptional regulator
MEKFLNTYDGFKYVNCPSIDQRGVFCSDRDLEVLFIRTSHFIERALKKELRRLNIAPKIGAMLTEIYWRESLSPTELSKISDRKPQTITAILDRMEKEGLVKRVKNENKRNTYKIYLTDKGLSTYQKIITIDIFPRIIKQFSQKKRLQLQNSLEELAVQAKRVIG